MSFANRFKGGTLLQWAIERGLKPGGNLVAELEALDDCKVKSKSDALAICKALQALDDGLLEPQKGDKTALYALSGLFQAADVKSNACDYLREYGIPRLVSLARRALADKDFDESELLFVLKMVAAYGTFQGTSLVIEVAQSGFASAHYLWTIVLGMFSVKHPEAGRLFEALSDPLPSKFLAVALLDAANQYLIGGGETRHPFDSDPGVEKLGAWLNDTDPDNFSYAISATAALPFIGQARQAELFRTAIGHPDLRVRLEAAWAAAKAERPGGLEKLVELCNNVNLSSQAKAYLKELNREDAVPKESALPEFMARAEFAQWLAHPSELGRFPDELEIVDHRNLRWPVDGETKHFWLIKYRVKDTTGLAPDETGAGLVGSITFCLFSYELEQRHPEDGYAIHCYWELSKNGQIADGSPKGPAEYATLLQQWNGPRLESPEVVAVSEVNPSEKCERRLVAVASAKLAGRPGWAVLDGPQSRWYPADELPEGELGKKVLMVHIGRRVLGFKQEPDRKKYLRSKEAVPPEQIVRVYEQLVVEAENGPASRCKQLIGNHGLLSNHFEAYLDARHKVSGGSRLESVAETYERILEVARRHPDEAGNLLDSWGALGKNFEPYVQALIDLKRPQEVVPLIELFAPHWQHNLGYGTLGGAAFRAGRDDVAEKFLRLLKAGLEDWPQAEEMSFLAEIIHRQGKAAEAHSLLVECLQKTAAGARQAEGSDRKIYAERLHKHRKVFARLFPSEPHDQFGLSDLTGS